MESTFWDHSQRWNWEWFYQMLKYKNVYFFYDLKKKCFVRKVTHVKGERTTDLQTGQSLFRPYPHNIIKYNQWM